ncbi:MAG: non-ribosomal peptide synthetase [Proteobacteria bacterium]|nr:non-ribosomal peptide synthetase [Pseudomonadota bacterium]
MSNRELSIEYWVKQLSPFTGLLPLLPLDLAESNGNGAGQAAIEIALPEDIESWSPRGWPGESLDRLTLVALLAILRRYHPAGVPLVALVADSDEEFLFVTGGTEPCSAISQAFGQLDDELDAAQRHRAVPFADIAHQLGLKYPDQTTGFFQIGYYTVSPDLARPRGICSMEIAWVEKSGCRELLLRGASDRFGADWLRSFGRQLLYVAGEILSEQHSHQHRPSTVPLLSRSEAHKVAMQYGMRPDRRHEPLALHRGFERQAARIPFAPAVTHRGETLSYRELDRLANGLACLLCDEFAVQPGDRVGLVLDRSAYMVAAILAILKAGAAYVPINPRHPWHLKRAIAENARLDLLLVAADQLSQVSAFDGELLVLDFEIDTVVPMSRPPAVQDDLARLAYIIHTSGSTGEPRGVAVTHRAICNTVAWRISYYGIDESNVNLQLPSYAFDSSVADIFSTLSAGGHLIVPDETKRLDTQYLVDLMRTFAVTSFLAVPSYYRMLLRALPSGDESALRWVTLAGEAAWPALVAHHYDRLAGVKLYNEYGPTENAVCSTACLLEPGQATVAIGVPIDNVYVFVLDEMLRPVPAGVPGEIYLGGAGLAEGYYTRDGMDRSGFVASPIPDVHRGMLYKTGDRAYWRPDGLLVYVGRIDRQVKLRGFRIELDHVESALLRLPEVDQAAVVVKGHDANASLVAYVSLCRVATNSQFRAALGEIIPYYMIPDQIHVVEELPRNRNGKVDRLVLTELEDEIVTTQVNVPALDPLTDAVLEIWRDALQSRQLGPHDQFFEYGGNSLKALQVVDSTREQLNLDINVLQVYLYPTVAEFVAQLHSLT